MIFINTLRFLGDFCGILIGAFKVLVLEDAWVDRSNIVDTGFMLMPKRHLSSLLPFLNIFFQNVSCILRWNLRETNPSAYKSDPYFLQAIIMLK